ncbi:Uncharacterised protein [Canicola haemoglobinophilus]|uniref:Lipoprotein n=1 Tax=Canicola haemoglobinophilus TaxID=733 RepID=A0A377HXM0_9PAST|nr:hypothetical protein [Canicola haemoglobinophilus]STO53914.1 Uncharacterised protein [Canicola haemoglobinophilus]STO60649.1 Uncharacterised protein [Canicola haemoglobinophilus]STO68447.1 Uncharacterised protein [Canicola haemoglobinophilus]
MKKLLWTLAAALLLCACSQPKDIYFNGSEGSHSGLKFDKSSSSFKINQ